MEQNNRSKKDEIILQQLEVIRTMTENNLSRMSGDFWGAPASPVSNGSGGASPQSDESPKPAAPAADSAGGAAPAQEETPPENIEDLLPEETLKVSIKVNPDQSRTVSWEDTQE